jgi:hypothetical protein
MRTFVQKPKPNQQIKSTDSTTHGRVFTAQHNLIRSTLYLQRTIGNQAVLRLLRANNKETDADSTITASTRSALDFSQIPLHPDVHTNVQTKLTVTIPGDIYEQEADRVAEQVMRMPEPQLQRACTCGGECPKCKREQRTHKQLQTESIQGHDADGVTVPPIVQEVLSSPGQPLDSITSQFMESRFGHDFSKVRVHTDAPAAKSARALGARAYTVENNVIFGASQFMPGTTVGRRLLAHELTHVLQQTNATNLGSLQSTSVSVQRVVSEEERRDAAQLVGELQIEMAGIERMVDQQQESGNEEEELHYSLWAAAVEEMIIALRALARGEEREDARRYLGQSVAQLVQEAERSVGEVAARESEVDLGQLETALRIQIAHAALAHESGIHRGDVDAAARASLVQGFLTEKLALVSRMIRGDASARRELGSLRGTPGDIIQRWVRAAAPGLRERISDRAIEAEMVILQRRVAAVQQRLERLERLLALAEAIFRSATAEGAALTTLMEGIATLGRAVGALRNAATAPIWLMGVRVINVRYNVYGGIWAPGLAFALMRENFSRIAQYRELFAQFIATRDDLEQNRDIVFLMEYGLDGVRDEATEVADEMEAILVRLNELGSPV